MQDVTSEHLKIVATFVGCFLLAATGVYGLVDVTVTRELDVPISLQGPHALANMISAARSALP